MGVLHRAGLAATLIALFCSAPPARAGIASEPVGENPTSRLERRGLYLGLGGGAGLQLATGLDARFGYEGEAKLGFSFNRGLQLYLSGAVHNASYSQNTVDFQQQAILITFHLHRFLFLDRSGVGVFYDAGIGVGIASPGFSGGTGLGLGYAAGIGVEIPLSPYISLVPEFYYRGINTSESSQSGRIDMIGIQLGLVYY